MTFGVLTLGLFDRGGASASFDMARQTGEAFRQGGRLVSETMDAFSRTARAGTSGVTGAAQQAAQSTVFNDQTEPRSYASSSRSST